MSNMYIIMLNNQLNNYGIILTTNFKMFSLPIPQWTSPIKQVWVVFFFVGLITKPTI